MPYAFDGERVLVKSAVVALIASARAGARSVVIMVDNSSYYSKTQRKLLRKRLNHKHWGSDAQ
jgi:hypothetical protein